MKTKACSNVPRLAILAAAATLLGVGGASQNVREHAATAPVGGGQ